MNSKVLRVLTEDACASIRFRTRKEILEEEPDVTEYLDEILNDKRITYVFTWQKPNGFLGQSFHGGWIPDAKMKFYNTGTEAALRFLSEMRVPITHHVVENCLSSLLEDNWNPDPWRWAEVYEPEVGLYGWDHIRAVVFSYFGIEEHDFIKTDIQRTFEVIDRIMEIKSIENITGTYRNKLYYSRGIALPDVYHLKLLASTKGWRNEANISTLTEAINHLIRLSPLPHIYIKKGSQLIAPAEINPRDLKQSLCNLQPRDWYWWLQSMELFARMGIVKQVPALLNQVNELKEMLQEGEGFFPFKPLGGSFEKWSVYAGLALEDSWVKNRWKYDLTFRALLILKYAGLL